VLELGADRQLDDLQVSRTATRLIRAEFLRTGQTSRSERPGTEDHAS
jgi:hypothetical protein